MRSLFNETIVEKLGKVRAGLRHAFALQPENQPFAIEDVQLMERIAEVIVQRRMAAPATMFLESMGPMNFLGSQALHFLMPILDCAFFTALKEVEQVARLLERRDTMTRLITIIEAKSAPQGATAQ